MLGDKHGTNNVDVQILKAINMLLYSYYDSANIQMAICWVLNTKPWIKSQHRYLEARVTKRQADLKCFLCQTHFTNALH